jgi:hypothetical protein
MLTILRGWFKRVEKTAELQLLNLTAEEKNALDETIKELLQAVEEPKVGISLQFLVYG